MKKIKLLTLLFAALLVSGNVWGKTVSVSTVQNLQAAIDTVHAGDVIQLANDIDGSSNTSTAVITVTNPATFTLDLNNHNIKGGKGNSTYGTLCINAACNLTITDNSDAGDGSIGVLGTSENVLNILNNDAQVTLEKGTIHGKNNVVYTKGKFFMNGGAVKMTNSGTSIYYGVRITNKGFVTISGGTVYAETNGKTWAIYGGVSDGYLYISGGSFYAKTTGSNKEAYAVCGYNDRSCPIHIFGGYFGHESTLSTQNTDVFCVTKVMGGHFMTGADLYSDGYGLSSSGETHEGKTYYEVISTSSTSIVQVGDNQYASLQKAFDEAPDNSMVTLLQNVSLYSGGATVPRDKTLTLDLNGYTISNESTVGSGTSNNYTKGSFGLLNVYGTLTVTDSEQTGAINAFETGSNSLWAFFVGETGTLNWEKGNLNVSTVSGLTYGIQSKGTTTISGGTIKVKETGTSSSKSIYAINRGGGTINITGGNFHIKTLKARAGIYLVSSSGTQIKGGVFTHEGATGTPSAALFAFVQIEGGQFNFDPSAFIPVSDKMLISNGTDKVSPFGTELTLQYSVVTNPSPTMVIKNITSNQEYASPYEAVSQANEGDELQLLVDDLDLTTYGLTISKGLTLDLNGHTLRSLTTTISIKGGTEENPIIIESKAENKGKVIGDLNAIKLDQTYSNVVLRNIETVSSQSGVMVSQQYCKILAERVKIYTTSHYTIDASMSNSNLTLNDCDFQLSNTATSSNYALLNVGSNSNLTINSGTYVMNVDSAKAYMIYSMSTPSIEINGGRFLINTKHSVHQFFNKANENLKIKGGYFTEKADPNNWLHPDYDRVTSDIPDYAWKVVEKPAAMDVEENEYRNILEAVAAVVSDPSLNPITLLRNVTVSSTLELPAGVTFAETSYTLTLSGKPALILQSGAVIPACLGTQLQASSPSGDKTYYYSNIFDAFKDRSYIKLEMDISTTSALLADGGTKTLDLNGHKLSKSADEWFISVKYASVSTILNLINSAPEIGVIENTSTGEDARVVDIDKSGIMDYPESSARLVIGENVKLKGNSGVYMWKNNTFLDVYGSIESSNFAIAGNGTEANWGTNIHIYEGANITSTGAPAIYHPQYGELVIDGGTISGSQSAIEVRSGDITINGGIFSASADTIACQPNSNGTTTIGAGIAVSQHVTKNPINVTINGGTFTAQMAMIQINPQNNSELDYKKMIVNVNGGNFWSNNDTSATLFDDKDYGKVTYATDEMFISQNRRIFLRGGYYNNDPVKFVAAGYQRIKLADIPVGQRTPEDLAAIAAEYKYKIGEIHPESAVTTTDCEECPDWKNNAADLWSNHKVPTDSTPIVIVDKEVIITTPAHAYSVTLQETGSGGTTKLTIKDGGMLMVGSGGVQGADSLKFIVEDGGMLCVAPNASAYEKPEGTVIVSSDYARRKDATADAKEVGALTTDDLYWRHIACPTINADRKLTLSQTGKTYISTWDLLNGWTSKGKDDWKTPFVGYSISTTLLSTTRASDTVLYTFKGKLAGNMVEPLNFSRIGFTFFGNSYLAPIDIRELLTSLDVNEDVESSVILYRYDEDWYEYINWAAFAIPTTQADIDPLQGFFIFSDKKSSVDYNYTKAVWDAFCAKARVIEFGGSVSAAPARKQSKASDFDAIACVQLTSNNGKHDKVYLFEGADYSDLFDKGYDARKMNVDGFHIAALGADNELAIIATDNLEGTALTFTTNDATEYTLSFSNVSGKDLAIYDALTGVTTNMTEGAIYNFTADANTSMANRFQVVNAHKMPTDLVESKAPVAAKGVYTILGEYLGEGDTWLTLPSGVYIVNGEKMVR